MKKILILGANGFIGKNLKEYLSCFSKEYVLYVPNSQELNLLNEQAVKKYLTNTYFDVIINAAVCNPIRGHNIDIQCELEQDLRMYYNLKKYNNLYGKMLYFGSGAEYDKSKDISFVTETEFINNIPLTQYGLAKYIIGKDIEQSSNVYNLRIFGLFGKYENWRTTFISGACCKALKGLPITIRQNVFFDYMYIDDFCKIIKWFIDNKPKYHTYNITTGDKIDLFSLCKLINNVIGKTVPVYVCKDGLGNEYTASNKRLLNEIGDIKFTPFKEAVEGLIKYYQSVLDEIDMYHLLYQN